MRDTEQSSVFQAVELVAARVPNDHTPALDGVVLAQDGQPAAVASAAGYPVTDRRRTRLTAAERERLAQPYRRTGSRVQTLFGDRRYDDALLRPRSITWPAPEVPDALRYCCQAEASKPHAESCDRATA